MGGQNAADRIRGRIGAAIIERIAGPRAASRRHPADPSPGEGWFGEDRPIRQVHSDSAMFIGAIRALLLQSLHPLAMAAVAEHSDYRGDPWGRLQRTSHFIGVTTFGRTQDAKRAIARVRAIHQRVTGTAPDGRPYAASDPHLLAWVHVAEADSFLRPILASVPAPWIRPGATGTWPTWPSSAPSSESPTRRGPRPSWPTGSGPTGPSWPPPPKPERRPGSCCCVPRSR